MIYDLAIVGTGPAGLSAAIYGSRGQLKTVIFGDETKGNLYKAHIIANYFGFPDSPSGAALTEQGLKQSLQFGAEHFRTEIVDIVVNSDQTFTLKDNLQQEYQSRTVIIATGQSYLLSGIKGEEGYTGKGVSYCVTCDGFFFKKKKVLVVGNTDFAADEALQLTAFTSDVTIVSHGKDLEFSAPFKKDLDNHGIKYLKTPRIASIEGEGKVEKIVFTAPLEKGENVLTAEGVFMAAGMAGANSFAKKLGLEMEGNYIKVDKNGYTNIKGVFAAGDCTGAPPQAASSVGNGCNAALAAIKLIRGLGVYIQYN
jgi:thioredoxin reductase (NADPH)